MMEIKSGQLLFGSKGRSVYDLLPFFEPGLLLDVGAAAGSMTRKMLIKSPDSNVKAFEPYTGNLPFFRETIGVDERVRLYPVAVCDEPGTKDFHVGSTVAGSESGWESMKGYSSVGRLLKENQDRSGNVIKVQTIGIDEAIGNEHVRFMKIDVQGGELAVLRSAKRAIDENRIDLMFVEFTGERTVLDFLEPYDPVVYDTDYLVIPRPRLRRWFGLNRRIDFSNWSIFKKGGLSTGREAYFAWPNSRPIEAYAYCDFMRAESAKIGYVQTDLVIVAKHFFDEFETAVSRMKT